MPIVKCRFLDVLLYNILILRLLNLSGHNLIFLLLVTVMWIMLQDLNTLFDFQVFVHSVSFSLSVSIENLSHLLNLLSYEDSSSLRSRLRFANKKYYRIIFSLWFPHHSIFYLFSSLVLFLFCVFLNIMEFSWVYPCGREEVIVIWKLFLEALQVHSKCTLPANVVHSKVMIYSLTRGKTA